MTIRLTGSNSSSKFHGSRLTDYGNGFYGEMPNIVDNIRSYPLYCMAGLQLLAEAVQESPGPSPMTSIPHWSNRR